jgi:hypothetical protein
MIGQSAGKSFAYVLGVFLGDGCVTTTGKNADSGKSVPVFKLNTIDADFANATKKALSELSDKSVGISVHAVSKSSKPNHSLWICDADLCHNFDRDTQAKRIIPEYVWGWCRENKLAFIAGLMDSEGFVAQNKGGATGRSFYMGFKSCDEWVPDFIRLLNHVGILIGKVQREKPRKPGYKTPTRFSIKMQSWVDSGARFNIARKQERVDRWAACVPYTERSRYPRKLTSEANMPDTPITA